MKKDTLLKGAAVIGAIALMAGGMVAVDAAVNDATVKNLNTNSGVQGQRLGSGKNLNEADRAAYQADREARRTAVTAALNANDYAAWVKAEGATSPMATKVTEANFAKFVEAHKLMDQARTIFTDLGLENGEGKGMGMGHGLGIGAGTGRMMNK
jgi:hypothetical protein